jgi:hypothetical protein
MVKDNPQSTSRPVFLVSIVNAKWVRSTAAVSNERVSDSVLCTCTQVFVPESGATYCSVSGADNVSTAVVDRLLFNRVSVCERKN